MPADFIDAVVISGGEPLVQSDAVIEILKYVHKLGLKTNWIPVEFIQINLRTF